MGILINLDAIMAKQHIGLTELSDKVGITLANLSILKNNRARAVRFTTLDAICKALDCQPGDILTFSPETEGSPLAPRRKKHHGLHRKEEID